LEVERARIESEAEHLTRACFSELAMSLEDVVTSVELARAAERQGPGAAGHAPVDEDAGTPSDQARVLSDNDEGVQTSESDDAPPALDDIDAARARLNELRVKLDDMGPVNMMALEELEEAEERFKFLTVQRADILDSIKLTEEALTEIKR